jgi:hypothetical protein
MTPQTISPGPVGQEHRDQVVPLVSTRSGTGGLIKAPVRPTAGLPTDPLGTKSKSSPTGPSVRQYNVVLQSLPNLEGTPVIIWLRRSLKAALRVYGLKCVRCEAVESPAAVGAFHETMAGAGNHDGQAAGESADGMPRALKRVPPKPPRRPATRPPRPAPPPPRPRRKLPTPPLPRRPIGPITTGKINGPS